MEHSPPDKDVNTVVEHDEESVQELKTGHAVDDALQFVREHDEIDWTPEEERKILWKIDIRIIVLLLFANIFTACDSQAYGVAAIFGMIQDLKLYTIISLDPLVTDLTKYSWTSAILAFGNLISQYPLLSLAQRLPMGKFYTGVVFYSGAIALLFVSLTNFAGAMVLRFFYGFQGVGLPVAVLISSMWWKTEEQPLRIGLWMCGASIGSIVGQAFDYGAASIKGEFHNSPWKWIYILLGSLTVAYSIIFGIFFPDSPMKARFLTERERNIAVRRLQKNQTGIQTRKWKPKQALAALTDPQLWLLCVTGFTFSFGTGALGGFGPLVIESFGFDAFKTIQLYMPCSGLVIIVMVISGFMGNKWPNHRIYIAMFWMIPTCIGYALLWKLPRSNQGGLLTAIYISVFYYGGLIQTLGLLSSNIAGYTKKTTGNAMLFMVSGAGGIASPFVFKGSQAAAGFPAGMITVMVLIVLAEVSLATLLWYYKRFNRLRDEAMADPDAVAAMRARISEKEAAFLDLTETENPYFRYAT